MTTMLDKMAEAIYERAAQGHRDDQNGNWVEFAALPDELEWGGRQLWIAEVRAALEAIREPDNRMAEIGSWAIGPGGDAETKRRCATSFTAMIDAILAEKPEGE